MLLDSTFKICVDPFLCSPVPKKQEQFYGILSGHEINIAEFKYEEVVNNSK